MRTETMDRKPQESKNPNRPGRGADSGRYADTAGQHRHADHEAGLLLAAADMTNQDNRKYQADGDNADVLEAEQNSDRNRRLGVKAIE